MKFITRALKCVLIVCLLAGAAAAASTTLVRAAGALDPAAVQLQLIASGLSSPVFVTNAGDGSGRLFIVEQTGTIRIFKNGALLGTPFLDVHADIRYGGEQGLLALAFHPSYSSNGYFYIAYTAPGTGAGSVLTLKRFHVSADPDVADPSSGSVVLTIDHPTNSNHNGGTLAFGHDGFLYWSTGDGGSGGDPPNNAQHLDRLLGKILRLDVDSASPYAIPPGNPFVETPVDDPATLPEIWAYGLRNPWRMSFDRATHDLYIGDVGQSAWEEIDVQPAASLGGENYGWHILEGNSCYNPSSGCTPPTSYVAPVTTYDHSGGRCAVTGGYVYRGSLYPDLQGYYLYGDYCSGAMYALRNDGAGWVVSTLPDTPYNISSFGEDEQGEVFVTDLGGNIFHVTVASAGPPRAHPSDGTQVCLRPQIGVDLGGTAATRNANGGFDPSKVTLMLDGATVTTSPTTTIQELMIYPSAHVTILYTPPSNLATGSHQAVFTFPLAAGPYVGPTTLRWSFNAANIACGTTLTSGAAAADSLDAAAPPVEVAPATMEPASAAAGAEAKVPAPTAAAPPPSAQSPTEAPQPLRSAGAIAEVTVPTPTAGNLALLQPVPAPASRPRGHQEDSYIRRVHQPR